MAGGDIDSRRLVRGLVRVSSHLSNPGPLRPRIELLCKETTAMLECDRCSIFVVDEHGYRATYNWGNPPNIAAGFDDFLLPRDSRLGKVVDQMDAYLFVNDAKADPAWARVAFGAGIHSVALAPMRRADGTMLGFMTAEFNEQVGTFDDHRAELVSGCANLAQGALLAEEAELRKRELRVALDQSHQEERRRIGREIHDDPLQRIFGVYLTLQSVRDRTTDPAVAAQLDPVIDECLLAASNLRAVADLLPTGADAAGTLDAAIRALVASNPASNGWTFRLQNDATHPITPEESRILGRVADEALRNVMRHSGATSVVVSLSSVDSGTMMTVADDGSDARLVEQVVGAPALRLMQERVQAVGGFLRVSDGDDGGTRVETWLPHG